MKSKQRIIKRFGMVLLFSATYFLIMIITILLVFLGTVIAIKLGFVDEEHIQQVPLHMIAISCLIIGTVLSTIFSRLPLKPFYKMIDATNKIADGDYSVRLNLKGFSELERFSNSFNHMAEELGSVEMLRTDFINNFSHEFKTPIVSIRGFAKMLKKENLSEEEKTEYLDVIINESERLSELSMNVLNLSRIEQQSILTDKKQFNLSEQIRLVIAMLYKKWNSKHLDIDFDSEEIYYHGSQEMLKQVWINLLDNAIKFSPEYGTIAVRILPEENHISVAVFNQGEPISEEQAEHIFDKFYQADTSHKIKGNGLGLAIAKRIAGLHEGDVILKSSDESGNQFEVILPEQLQE